MRKILAIIMLVGAFSACSTDEVDTWNAQASVWFTGENNVTTFSFLSQADEVTEYVVELPLTMAGPVSDVDRNVRVNDLGCLSSETEYEILSATIPAGEVTGALRVNVRKTGNLDEMTDTIRFEIEASEDFELGLSEGYWTNSIAVSNILAQPVWWNDYAEMFLGYYYDIKLELIYELGYYDVIEEAGINEYFGGDEVTIAIYQLNRYCRLNNICYPSTDQIVEFDFWSGIE